MCNVNVSLGFSLRCRNKETYLTEAASVEGEKIAIVHVNNAIDNKLALSVVDSLRKIKMDPTVKSVILRVDSPGGSSFASEQILMECADLTQVNMKFATLTI